MNITCFLQQSPSASPRGPLLGHHPRPTPATSAHLAGWDGGNSKELGAGNGCSHLLQRTSLRGPGHAPFLHVTQFPQGAGDPRGCR